MSEVPLYNATRIDHIMSLSSMLRGAPPSGENSVRPEVPEAGFPGPVAGFSCSEAGPCRPEAGLSREQEAGLSWAR